MPGNDIISPRERHLRMPAQTDSSAAPHWIVSLHEAPEGLLLDIPEFGGQVSASLARGQDAWFERWLAGRAGVRPTWTTSWAIEDRATAQSLVDELVREFGAVLLDAEQHWKAYEALSDFVWQRSM